MFLRGQVPEDRLAFDPEIEKTARRNRGKRKKKQGKTREESSSTSITPQSENMENQRLTPARKTLGDYAMQQGPKYFSSIAIPPTTKTLEMKPAFLSLISSHQFTGMDRRSIYSSFYIL